MKTPLSETWNLETIFPGGSESAEFASFLNELEQDVNSYAERLGALSAADLTVDQWGALFDTVQDIYARLRQASAFISCLNAQNVKDNKAKLLTGRLQSLSAKYTSAGTLLDKLLLDVSDQQWATLLESPNIAPIAFPVDERRRRAANKLAPEQEALITDLSVDGYHAWGTLYGNIIGRMTIPFEKNGETVELSVGQAQNTYSSSADRDVRQRAFAAWEEAFSKEAEMIASCLNHLGGFRLQMYKHRGWDSILGEPLDINRMTRETLDTMWAVIEKNKAPLVQFLNRKAKLLGQEKSTWYDMYAPIGEASTTMTYEEGANFIVEQFRHFDPNLATFAERAFENAWIEAEDRAGKRPGGFCTSLPLTKETRIFMTYNGSASTNATLAHELGHAYHSDVLKDHPTMTQSYAMNVAETASTFAEQIVSDASIKNASSEEERLAMLEDKVQRAVALLMDIHARFIFEQNFYAEREKGLVSVERLNELMVDAQKVAFQGALDEYHPHFWASKLHFYSTGVPFYNFPYTFGFLFSTGVYAQALQEGPTFAAKYVALLQDTGRMTVEDLAQKHLGADLTKPDFWQAAMDVVLADVEEFMRLTEKK
ncbi:MAG TPA: M3 family oligoendopeptidase [Bacilli bacterium]|nr:M3 family oligoendopeptidase [Bacilli bacterium]